LFINPQINLKYDIFTLKSQQGEASMVHKNIVILANSRRHGAHCIAGKDLNTKEWVRPITIFGEGRKKR